MNAAPTWERKILRLVLLDNRNMKKPAIASLEADEFEDDRNMLIFATMKGLAREGKDIDIITVAEELSHNRNDFENAGGAEYIASLME